MTNYVIFPCTNCYNAVQVPPAHYDNFSRSQSGLFDLNTALTCPECNRKLLAGSLYQLELFVEGTGKSKIEIAGNVTGTNLFIGNNNVGQVQTDKEGKFVFVNKTKFRLSDKFLKDTYG